MAKRFVFRLETLLKIRQQREEWQQRIVAGRLRQIQETRRRIADLEQRMHAGQEAVRDSQRRGRIDLQQAMHYRHWIGHLHKNVLETQSHLGYLEAELVRERAALSEAAKQRKILDKLKERQWQRHLRGEDRREVNEADELATVRFVFDRDTKQELVHT
ncbi:MAG: flagellar export protein FliJ [Phycisphaerales bacterium]|nr:flagellar export protein FliJ [Phycisphaerales bacterium]